MSTTAKAGAGDGHVWLVGGGPGDPGYITVAGLAALRRADVVLYDRLSPPELLDECPPEAVRIDVGKAVGRQAMTQDQINAALVEHGRAGKRVVRLKGGDPFVFGRGGEEAEALIEAGIAVTEIPGITSAIGGLAAAGIPITHRGIAASFAVVTGHEAPTRSEQATDWQHLATAVDTLVVLMGVGNLDAIAAALIEGGRARSTPCALVHAATTPQQRVVAATLEHIAQAARDEGVEAPALFVVGEVVRLRSRLAAAGRGTLAGKRVLITRTRQQASSLAEALRSESALPVLLPAIEILRRADPSAVDAAVQALRSGAYGWVVFTSENAVEVTFELLRDRDADARLFAGARLCAIGPATADALLARGLRADLVPAEATGEGALAALLAAGAGGTQVLLPRAEGARMVLPDGLRAAGSTVDELTLYLAAPPASPPEGALDRIRRGEIDIVTFTSSSTVRNLVAVLGRDIEALRGALIACIGPSTADAAREAGFVPDVVAAEYTIAGLVAALRAAVNMREQA
ncbi:MAG: uroporphyrinogen-III C-methyltransferase [Chloroflexi bacterium]|nr:MAG: uroporphyrinogen-III C-methyltransferase [Chloroflexota bacterium]